MFHERRLLICFLFLCFDMGYLAIKTCLLDNLFHAKFLFVDAQFTDLI